MSVTPVVFVVDDDVSVRESLEVVIRSAGGEPQLFASAGEFIAHVLGLDMGAELGELRSRYAALSGREREVMDLVVSGLLNKQVGATLGISVITVKAHRGRVMRKMKANSLPDLVTMALTLDAFQRAALPVTRAEPHYPLPHAPRNAAISKIPRPLGRAWRAGPARYGSAVRA